MISVFSKLQKQVDKFVSDQHTSALTGWLVKISALLVILIVIFLDYKIAATILSGLLIIVLSMLCTVNPVYGFYIIYLSCFFLMFPDRLFNSKAVLPTGLVPELLTYATCVGFMVRQKSGELIPPTLLHSSILRWSLLMLAYYYLQYFNPQLQSDPGWFNFFRKQISFILFVYVSYQFLKGKNAQMRFTFFWIIVASVHALYAWKQQWFGFFGFEWKWLNSDIERYRLYVNMGFPRKFGLLSDPASAGILYSFSALITMVLCLRLKNYRIRILLAISSILSIMASVYTGTRTGYLMIIAGILFYLILTLYEKRTLMLSVIASALLAILVLVPAGNNIILNRVQSVFRGINEPSANVRNINRKLVQPYVYEHPFGGGINSSGLNGKRYSPSHYLSSIPPDSGYLQVMMEQGYIGLALLLIFYFLILQKGIKAFYRLKDTAHENICIAHLVAVFSLMVGQISQMAIGQYPGVLYFYTAIILFVRISENATDEPAQAKQKIGV